MKKEDKIYIAGHTGQIGAGIFEKLKKSGYTNIVIKNHSELDLLNSKMVQDFFNKEKPDYCFYCAGSLGSFEYFDNKKAAVLYENMLMQMNVLKSAVTVGVKKVLYLGSGSVYGDKLESPFTEENAIDCIQHGGLESYAIAKVSGLEFAKCFDGINGTKIISVLPTHCFGFVSPERMKANVIESSMKALYEAKEKEIESIQLDIWGTGKKALRQYVYLNDMADAIVYLMNNYDEQIPVNIATDEVYCLDDVIKILKEVIGYKGTVYYMTDKPERYEKRLLSTIHLKETGWKAEYTMHKALKDMVIKYKNYIG